jgi:hypothetical protein
MTPEEMRALAHKLRALSEEHQYKLRMQGCYVLLSAADVLRQLARIVEDES